VLTTDKGVADWGPAWSPDGSEIAFNSDRDTPGRLRGFVMDPEGGAVRRIGGDIWVEYPAWSPDGSELAFMAQTPEGTQNYEIFVMGSDGTNVRRLTDSPGDDGWPSWSPDGTRILFSSIRDDCAYSDAPDCKTTGDIGPYHTLYVMNADGSDQTRISDAFGQIADWSPDGRFIVFEDFAGREGLNVIRIDGSGLTTIPIRASNAGFPDWIS
jgi:TolB protein